MNKINRFLLCLLCVAVVFSFGIYSCAFGATDETTTITEQIICDTGYYLAKCGTNYVGLNWLKGYALNGDTNSYDFYDYADETGKNNIKNLRLFFNPVAGEDIIFTKSAKYDSLRDSIPSDDDDVVSTRNGLLTATCTASNATCAKCPGDGTVAQSTVKIYSTTSVYEWTVHTIADCYMNTFTDSTGTFKYVPTETSPTSAALNCNYTDVSMGNQLSNPNGTINWQYQAESNQEQAAH